MVIARLKALEPLSRRIDDEHRLICEVEEAQSNIISCRYHY
jgi:Txe/YoeB family toxin of Txe-Axe toxin-antitoxin module